MRALIFLARRIQPFLSLVDREVEFCVVVVVVVVDSHIQRIVLATEETTVTQQVSHRPIKRQSRLWSQRGTKVNGSHHGDNPLLRPTGIQNERFNRSPSVGHFFFVRNIPFAGIELTSQRVRRLRVIEVMQQIILPSSESGAGSAIIFQRQTNALFFYLYVRTLCTVVALLLLW